MDVVVSENSAVASLTGGDEGSTGTHLISYQKISSFGTTIQNLKNLAKTPKGALNLFIELLTTWCRSILD